MTDSTSESLQAAHVAAADLSYHARQLRGQLAGARGADAAMRQRLLDDIVGSAEHAFATLRQLRLLDNKETP